MKNHFLIICTSILLFCATTTFAQVPQLLNYQGIARDANGNPLKNQWMSIQLSVLPAADALIAEYEEVQTVKTNDFGLYTLQIGNGTVISGNMKTVKWETGNKYIKVGIDPNGGSTYVNAGTNQLLSVPYAIYADKAGEAGNRGLIDKSRTGAVNSEAGHLAGDAGYLTKFTALNTIGKSAFFQSAGGTIGLGTSAPTALAKLHIKQENLVGGNLEYIRMQNLDPNGFGKFLMHNDVATNYATFTKYGSTYAGGYPGPNIAAQFPYANLLAFGNNIGPFLLSNNGNVGIGIVSGGSTVLKFNVTHPSGNVGIGGSATPAATIHFNNNAASETLLITNNTTGHTQSDGLQISNSGNAASIINKENSSLDFGTSNTTRMSITPNGNVGIGILNPVEDALHIKRAYSSIRLEDSNDNVSLYLVAPDPSTFTTGGIGTSTFHELPFWTNNIERLVIKADGNIGIGTNTPATTLDVNGQIKIQGGSPAVGKVLTSDATGLAAWQNSNSWNIDGNANINPAVNFIGTTNSAPLRFMQAGIPAGYINSQFQSCYFGTNAGLAYSPGNTGNAAFGYNAMRKTDGGSNNTSIGAYTLDSNTVGSSNTAVGVYALQKNVSGSYNTALGNFASQNQKLGSYNTAVGYYAHYQDSVGSNNIAIGKFALYGIAGDNNVGLGNYTGASSSIGSGNVFIGNYGGFQAGDTCNNKFFINNNNNFSIPLMYGDFATGQIAIGTKTPSAKFTVVDGTTGTYTPTGWLHSSDARLKTSINPLSNSLQKILQLNGVSYYWKFSQDSNKQIGFIAQDVEKIFPEVVVVDKDGKYGMAYQNLVAPMVEAMKEQQLQIEALQNQNKLLVQRLEALEKK